jgi:hypothetical protein
LTRACNVISIGILSDFMPPAPAAFRCRFALLVLAGTAMLGRLDAIDLTPNSPFLPPGGGTADANATPAGTPLELHGIITTPDGYKFDLFDPNSHKDMWVGFNETGKPYVVHSHDIAHNRVTVEYQGRELTLTLPQPTIAPMTAAQMAQAMPVAQPAPLMGQPPVANTSNPEDERRRIQLITEEIKRRRALRAAQQRQQQLQSPGNLPAPVPSPPQPRDY